MISLRRGVNLSHWLSQSDRRGEARRAWTTREDFLRIRDFGFDHVRLPLDEEQLWTESGTKETEAWDLLERALDWASEAGLGAVCDMHILRGHHFNQEDVPALYTDAAVADIFCSQWTTLALALGRRSPDLVALEVLNEAVARDPADWNRVSSQAFAAIRAAAPGHTIVLGSNWYCMCETFPELSIPDDPNQILTFHFYNPMFVTHHQASWTPGGAWKGPVNYPGKPWPDGIPDTVEHSLAVRMFDANVAAGPETMLAEIAPPLARAKETGLGLYCGEFGVIRLAPVEIRRAWLRDAVRTFESNGIGWAMWDWKGVFGVVDALGEPTGIHEALFGG